MASNKAQKCFRCAGQIEPDDKIYRKSAGVYLCSGCGVLAESEPPQVGPVEQGVLDDLDKLPDEARDTVVARSMLLLAHMLDLGDVPPREIPAYTKDLRIGYMQLRDLFPSQVENDPTTAAREARERRMREQSGM
jgi:hypothetical protein